MNDKMYSPKWHYTTIGNDIEKINNSKPSAVKTPPPPKPQK